MSRRSRTTLYLSVKIPVPSSVTHAQAIEDVNAALQAINSVTHNSYGGYATGEILVKLERKEVAYY